MRKLLILVVMLLIATTTAADAKKRRHLATPGLWRTVAFCVHGYEGPWNANTHNGYYGGMQMDLAFQRRYGGWILAHHGTADNWPPNTQLLVAYRGWKERGWYPWPNTARKCGLL